MAYRRPTTKEEKAKVDNIMKRLDDYPLNLPRNGWDQLVYYWKERSKLLPIDMLADILDTYPYYYWDPTYIKIVQEELSHRIDEEIILTCKK